MCKFTTIILLCSVFSIFSTQLSAQNADLELLRRINNTSATIGYSKFISNTTTEVSFGVPVVMGVVALISKDDELLKSSIYVGASIGVGGVLTQVLKYSINRPRPITLSDPYIVAYESQRGLSFPSGHTSLAFSVATALSLKYPKWYVAVPGYLWAGSVGYSRMNLGVHYPSDVLAGALLGAGSAYVTYKINNWFWKKEQNKKLIGLQSYL
ncbi:MAG: phosphatase PAP2 family protein [Paludibacter sp.]